MHALEVLLGFGAVLIILVLFVGASMWSFGMKMTELNDTKCGE